MNKEIELKAWVENPEKLRDFLTEIYGKPEVLDKSDIYYLYPKQDDAHFGQPVRLRKENGLNIVTLKKKSYVNGIEINDEIEFKVDEPENFLKFLELSGASSWIRKTKKGWKFKVNEENSSDGRTLIELCEVSTLGWFIEIETVVESPDQSQIEQAEARIRSVLKKSGVAEEKIEPRCYSDLLIEKM